MPTGNVIETWQDCLDRIRRPIRTVSLLWTSDAAGNVAWTLAGGEGSGRLSGLLERVAFIPGISGGQPTNGYAVTLIDANGIDLLAGQGSGLSNTAASHVKPSVPMKDGATTSTDTIAVDDVPTLNVTGAGNAKSGTVIIYIGGGGA